MMMFLGVFHPLTTITDLDTISHITPIQIAKHVTAVAQQITAAEGFIYFFWSRLQRGGMGSLERGLKLGSRSTFLL